MGLVPVYTADGSPLQDAGGVQIYVVFDGPNPQRVVGVAPESRCTTVPYESRVVQVRPE